VNLFAKERWRQRWFLRLPGWLAKVPTDVAQEEARVRTVERDLGLPVRAALVAVLFWFFYYSPWFEQAELFKEGFLDIVRTFFLIYALLSVVAGVLLAGISEVPFRWIREVVLALSLLDAFLLSGLVILTGGFDSYLFWLYLVLIIRNALSMPDPTRQIIMNLLTTGAYVSAGLSEMILTQVEIDILDPLTLKALYPYGAEPITEPVLLRLGMLLLLTACCYGVEVLFDRQRRVEQEAREVEQRQRQLESAGRLAAEIAHQLKNPLGIINNAAFTLQRTVKEGKTITQQIKIIREEVERSDRIITELMGYARLVEGKVEKLDVVEELESALQQVFPAAVKYETRIVRDFAPALPPLLAQRTHLSLILVNLLQNAREALNGGGQIVVSAHPAEGFAVQITIADDGPGIPPDKVDKVFEPYFSTKEKGSGLGLAIVKHNTEMYGGTVRVESTLGKGTTFILQFPARTVVRLRR
jgi:signal transduction histidine kinase